MKVAIFDTSALIRLYIPDGPLPNDTEELLEQAWRAEALILVPELALAEAAQVLHKKLSAGIISHEESREILDSLLELPLEVVGHRDLLPEAMAIARKQDITVYDALFIALAAEQRGRLITADERLAAVWNEKDG